MGLRPGAPHGGVDCGKAEACTGMPFAVGADAWEFMRAGWAPPCGVMSDAPRRRLACFPPGKKIVNACHFHPGFGDIEDLLFVFNGKSKIVLHFLA